MRTIEGATELLPPGSDIINRDTWLATRRAGVTASEIAVILGLSKWNSPMGLYFQKRGELDEGDDNDRMRLGRVLEPYVLTRFEEETGEEAEPCGLLASRDRPWQLATPDAVCGVVPVEAKTSLSEDNWGPSGSDEVPVAYRAQLIWQCDVLDVPYGYLCAVFLRSGEARWYKVSWDADDVGVMREAALEFLDYLDREEIPPADTAEATQRALRAVYRSDDSVPDATCGAGLLRSYRAALRAYGTAEDRKRLATSRIRLAMGNSARLRGPDGEIVASKRGPHDALYPARGLTE
jgi:putative phage-type endonuclease